MSIINRAAGIFGRMGQNQSINALTNANALASQQPAMGNSMMAKPDMSQQIMTGSFDPLTQQVGMGIFGDQNARNMAVRGSGIMKHDEWQVKIDEAKKKWEAEEKEGDFYEANQHLYKKQEEARKAHNSPAQHKKTGAMAQHEHIRPGETKTEFRNRISGPGKDGGEYSKKLIEEYKKNKADKKNK